MHCVHENRVCVLHECTISSSNAECKFPIWIPNYYSKANLDLMQVQCKMHNAMHDDKQIFFGFFENKEIQKAKEWL